MAGEHKKKKSNKSVERPLVLDVHKKQKKRKKKTTEEPPVLDVRKCLFDKHMSETVRDNVDRMYREFGFFVPHREYVSDLEGLIGHCQEIIKVNRACLYCAKKFVTWKGCQDHMISKGHTKLRCEQSKDMETLSAFYDFSKFAMAESKSVEKKKPIKVASKDSSHHEESVVLVDNPKELLMDEWEVLSDCDDVVVVIDPAEMVKAWDNVSDAVSLVEEINSVDNQSKTFILRSGYEEILPKFGFLITPLGELAFPDGRVVGNRVYVRYYKQRRNFCIDPALGSLS